MNQILGHSEDELPYYLKNISKWKEHLKDYENKIYSQISIEDSIRFLESVGFEVITANLHKPCDELDLHKDQIKDYLRTLLGHLNYLPEQYHEGFLQDATDWCNKNFPVNQRGNQYMRLEVMMLRAKKKLNY
ncbi:uncharacterized protein LOC117102769 [Anneissia japonica]|uniref:uncharacterized protein LOC117102769 n=1 Tax=Anneissia japonica TaxID=1529436 RepID=UPI0014257F80|nr:uncharacterized protein LOC117102769 [Anneissia japonica]